MFALSSWWNMDISTFAKEKALELEFSTHGNEVLFWCQVTLIRIYLRTLLPFEFSEKFFWNSSEKLPNSSENIWKCQPSENIWKFIWTPKLPIHLKISELGFHDYRIHLKISEYIWKNTPTTNSSENIWTWFSWLPHSSENIWTSFGDYLIHLKISELLLVTTSFIWKYLNLTLN